MDVDHPADPWRQRLAIEDAHEAGQHQPLGAAGADAGEQVQIERTSVRITTWIECQGGDVGRFGQSQRTCAGLVAADQHELDRQLATLARIEQRGKIAAAPGGEHGDAWQWRGHRQRCGRSDQPIRTRSSPCAGTISPITELARPCFASSADAAATASRGRITVKPMPQLKVRHISSRATLPSRISQSNTGGSTMAEASSAMPRPSGTTRMMFSFRPPPVMWAMPCTGLSFNNASIDLT